MIFILTKRKIYNDINDEALKIAERIVGNYNFQFDDDADDETKKRKDKLIEIGKYVYAGSVIGCKAGLYNKRIEIMQYIIKRKLQEFKDEKLELILKEPNATFQISDYMIAAVDEVLHKNNEVDEIYEEVKKFITENTKVSPHLLQKQFGIGYARAARLLDKLTDEGLIA